MSKPKREYTTEFKQKAVELSYVRVMGLRAVLPGKHISQRCKDHRTYPYLLGNLTVDRPNQVWATDNAFIERLWRNVKYEKIFLNPPKGRYGPLSVIGGVL